MKLLENLSPQSNLCHKTASLNLSIFLWVDQQTRHFPVTTLWPTLLHYETVKTMFLCHIWRWQCEKLTCLLIYEVVASSPCLSHFFLISRESHYNFLSVSVTQMNTVWLMQLMGIMVIRPDQTARQKTDGQFPKDPL